MRKKDGSKRRGLKCLMSLISIYVTVFSGSTGAASFLSGSSIGAASDIRALIPLPSTLFFTALDAIYLLSSRLRNSSANALYAFAPFDLGSYSVMAMPKLGASASLIFLGITVEYTFEPKYFFTS